MEIRDRFDLFRDSARLQLEWAQGLADLQGKEIANWQSLAAASKDWQEVEFRRSALEKMERHFRQHAKRVRALEKKTDLLNRKAAAAMQCVDPDGMNSTAMTKFFAAFRYLLRMAGFEPCRKLAELEVSVEAGSAEYYRQPNNQTARRSFGGLNALGWMRAMSNAPRCVPITGTPSHTLLLDVFDGVTEFVPARVLAIKADMLALEKGVYDIWKPQKFLGM